MPRPPSTRPIDPSLLGDSGLHVCHANFVEPPRRIILFVRACMHSRPRDETYRKAIRGWPGVRAFLTFFVMVFL